MFNTEFLHVIRRYELEVIKKHLAPGAKLLEIGGGTGIQAKLLADEGFDIVSIDIPQSQYASERVFSVIDYDGENIPFEDRSFDVVLSSNVLEHVVNLTALHGEIKRVLRPAGYCVHVMPSGSWRFWTNVAHYVELMQRIFFAMPQLLPRYMHPVAALYGMFNGLKAVARPAVRLFLLPPRHGECGNAVTEIYYFGRGWWRRHFIASGFDIVEQSPIGLFYTGHMVLGPRLGIGVREWIARRLGSACNLFKITPVAVPDDA